MPPIKDVICLGWGILAMGIWAARGAYDAAFA
ncbi:hypothetical protein F0726_02348 [Acidithiobacillus caldus]|nr:hypothetical protein F0726_02348 [Acidithiobacillus caldus]